jgi:hypothetical protein
MTALVLGARTDLKPPRQRTEAEILQPVGNLLLDLAESVTAMFVACAKRNRIVARLDDPAIRATPEQRAEAEAKASALLYEAERHMKTLRRKAKVLDTKWTELPGDLIGWIAGEAFPMPCWDDVALAVGKDADLMRLPAWRKLIVGREARKESIAS